MVTHGIRYTYTFQESIKIRSNGLLSLRFLNNNYTKIIHLYWDLYIMINVDSQGLSPEDIG